MSNVRKIHCTAEFNCIRCGKPYLSLAIAPWDPVNDKIAGDAERCGSDTCPDCHGDLREYEFEKCELVQAGLRWVKAYAKVAQEDQGQSARRHARAAELKADELLQLMERKPV